MDKNEKKIRSLIKKSLEEMYNVSESDLLVRAGVDWDEVKPKFLEKVNTLISKIDDDQYDDADDLIGSVITALRFWRHKIRKGQDNGMVSKDSNVATIDEELLEYFGGPSDEQNSIYLQKIKSNIGSLVASGYDKEKLKSMIAALIG